MAGLTAGHTAAIGRLHAGDVPAAAALSAAIGWNQDVNDWARLVALHPEGAYAARLDGELVGTTTLVSYGSALAWLGMVIVHPGRRGLGIGAALVDAALAAASATVIGLDATDLGAPLYERRGFVSVAMIDRWGGVLQADRVASSSTSVRRAGEGDSGRLADLDAALCGVDRAALLARLVAEPATTMLMAERGGSVVGFAAIRPGRERRHVGPVVAADDETLRALVGELSAVAAGGHVYLDSVRREEPGPGLGRFGLGVARTLKRMTRPAAATMAMTSLELTAATGLEWG